MMTTPSKRASRRPFGFLLLLPLLVACATAAAVPGPSPVNPSAQEGSEDQPRLIVYLVVDQLRGDLLDRYSSLFTGGFKRLMEEGRSFSNAYHQHAATETAPGHAALSTGSHPARAGIPSNVWQEEEGGESRPVYNVVDPTEGLVGIPGVPGASPRVLKRTGIADWVRKADPDSRVVSISAKDRAAVLMAGQSQGDVYWFDSQSGRFVTSTFYTSQTPHWVESFNQGALKAYRADSVWASTIPAGAEELSSPDTAAFEGDGVHTFFPHAYVDERIDPAADDFFMWLEGTPMLDRATLDFARTAIQMTEVGRTPGRTDYLSISLSQTDRVGHGFGPLSREQMDNLLRLDRNLGAFLAFLDVQVGKENYILGLTSDHGVMNNPERLKGGKRLTAAERTGLEQALGRAAREATRAGEWNPAPRMVDAIKDLPFVGPAYTHQDLMAGEPGDSLQSFFVNSFVDGRAGGLLSSYGVEMWWAQGILSWSLPTGTTHGGPFPYDRWVPLLLMGPTVEPGRVQDPVRPLDLAPTLAWLAGISYPEDLDGKPLPLGGEGGDGF